MDQAETITARVRMSIGGHEVDVELSMPTSAVDPVELLPLLWPLEDLIIGVAAQDAQARGESISCRAGCGQCCRQMVPVSRTEARRLAALVAAMPQPRQAQVRRRFDEARTRVEQSGLLDRMDRIGSMGREQLQRLGLEWFALGVACPFLEDESCSIHAERPLVCREYLVTSPAQACANPSADTVTVVKLAGQLSRAAARLDDPRGTGASIPLLLALDASRIGPAPAAPEPAPVQVRQVFARLAASD